ncbi:metallophosphoesterase [Saccharomonospora sp. NPDC046836]|uniref:metallophosphoesterase n=1 Tax=Saccharomonospora sp. NPDC046836 TaxID=3156921 RepID=UPI00340676D0
MTKGEKLQRGGLPDAADSLVTEATKGFPFQRFELVATENLRTKLEIAWSGRSTGNNELQLYAWNHRAEVWDLLAAGRGIGGEQITLIGKVDKGVHTRGRTIDILVQDGPATRGAFHDDAAEPNRAFKDPAEYDFSFGYMTDTQFLNEGYRSQFAEMNRWIVKNQEARKIAYTFHTGDLIENWLNGTHGEARARDEYEFASSAMGILDEAGHPYGVTPGNHDDKWGRDKELYNEFFPPERLAGKPWSGGTWKEDDSQNHYEVMEINGAKFLMIYLGYFAGDDAIEWANGVLAAHPDHNVIFATHEYIHPDGTLSSPDTYRWTSMGQRFWNELVLPNENVFMVLSGHFHGVALNIKRDVGGVEGRVVVEMMADYQNFLRDGHPNTGFLRLLQVDIDAKRMAVNTYAPAYDEHNAWKYDPEGRYDDTDDEFTIEVDLNDIYDKRVETDLVALQSAPVELGTVRVGAGETATVNWPGLRPGASYTWYVRSTDGGGRDALSPVSTFAARRS